MDPLDGSVLGGFGGEGGGRREGGVKVVLSDPSGSGLYNKVSRCDPTPERGRE
jgi:hypothetical protein